MLSEQKTHFEKRWMRSKSMTWCEQYDISCKVNITLNFGFVFIFIEFAYASISTSHLLFKRYLSCSNAEERVIPLDTFFITDWLRGNIIHCTVASVPWPLLTGNCFHRHCMSVHNYLLWSPLSMLSVLGMHRPNILGNLPNFNRLDTIF